MIRIPLCFSFRREEVNSPRIQITKYSANYLKRMPNSQKPSTPGKSEGSKLIHQNNLSVGLVDGSWKLPMNFKTTHKQLTVHGQKKDLNRLVRLHAFLTIFVNHFV